jgi:hypothetical protein
MGKNQEPITLEEVAAFLAIPTEPNPGFIADVQAALELQGYFVPASKTAQDDVNQS